jgi:hypothetical protein
MKKEHLERYNPPVKPLHKGARARDVQKHKDKGGLGRD